MYFVLTMCSPPLQSQLYIFLPPTSTKLPKLPFNHSNIPRRISTSQLNAKLVPSCVSEPIDSKIDPIAMESKLYALSNFSLDPT